MVSRRNAFYKKIETSAEFPVLADVQRKVMDLLSGNKSLAAIAKVAQEDVTLTTNILKVANSMRYAGVSKKPVGNIEDAIVRLGIEEFKRLLLSFSVIHSFRAFGTGKVFQRYWQHSMQVASTMVNTYEQLHSTALAPQQGNDLYTAGLLHDVGILLLDYYFPNHYRHVLDAIQGKVVYDLHAIEFAQLGIDHQEVGAFFAEKMGLPVLFQDLIRFHHEPERYTGEFPKELATLCFADNFATSRGLSGLETFSAQDKEAQETLEHMHAMLKVGFIARKIDEELSGEID